MTLASLKTRYRGTWTGFLWTLLNPLIMFGAQSFAFNYILKIEIKNYGLFLLSGLLPWLFINQTIDMGMSALITNGKLIKSFPVHPIVLLISVVTENFFNFLVAFTLTIVPSVFVYQIGFLPLLLVVFPLAGVLVGTVALVSMAAITNVFFRDMRFIINFLLSISFFLTPIFYDVYRIPPNLLWLLNFNVFFYMIDPFQQLLHEQNLMAFALATLKVIALDVGLVALAVHYWNRKRNELYAHL